eukprot:CAMPEP_0178968468 /NCGR_PEP_ID=MMETSP0789-20121207/18275_1 /TAXON_ID=3005 /ORGANISM="Rhizosolenia setigera, Strain CCMP 1694" /LENGTH=146 /DNA_ID=CAMNT_0020654409 /DNA_START=463 /DNA_END=899 /DNA_ORIENTATION=-
MIHPQLEAFLQKTFSFLFKYPSLSEYKKLKDLAEKTGHNKVYIFFLYLFLADLPTILILLGVAKLVTDLVSIDYWVVFAFISIVEGACRLLNTMYFFGRVAFFVWLYHPSSIGAGVIYDPKYPVVNPDPTADDCVKSLRTSDYLGG